MIEVPVELAAQLTNARLHTDIAFQKAQAAQLGVDALVFKIFAKMKLDPDEHMLEIKDGKYVVVPKQVKEDVVP